MAITQGMCTSFKAEILGGTHDLATDVLKIALFTNSATLSVATTAYSTSGEVVGTGYTAGGMILADAVISSSGTTAIVDFTDPVWSTTTLTARGALIYNSTKANRAIAVLDFGTDKTTSGGDFDIVLPAPTASTAIVRIA